MTQEPRTGSGEYRVPTPEEIMAVLNAALNRALHEGMRPFREYAETLPPDQRREFHETFGKAVLGGLDFARDVGIEALSSAVARTMADRQDRDRPGS